MNKQWLIGIFTVLILAMSLTACGAKPTTPSTEGVETDPESLPPVAAVKAREALAAELNIGIEDVTIDSHEQKTWSDSCLGLGGAAESCLQAEVDGWLVLLSANDQIYNAHTDWLGDQVRFEP